MVGHFILKFPCNREDSLVRFTRKLTEDFTALLLLISTSDLTGIKNNGIHGAKYGDNDDAAMADSNKSEPEYCGEK